LQQKKSVEKFIQQKAVVNNAANFDFCVLLACLFELINGSGFLRSQNYVNLNGLATT